MKAASAVTVLLALLFVAIPAAAAPLTLNFFGSIDLSEFGASASSTFDGAATWDTAANPAVQGNNFAFYLLDSIALTVNGIDVSATFDFGTVEVTDASNFDNELTLQFQFSPPINLGAVPGVQYFFGTFRGPQTLFSGTGVPQDLTFLASVTSADSAFQGGRCGGGEPPSECVLAQGTLAADTEVPEPGSIFLLGSGIVGAALRKRRRQRGKSGTIGCGSECDRVASRWRDR